MRLRRVTLVFAAMGLAVGCASATSASDVEDPGASRQIGRELASDVIRVGSFAHVQALAVSRSRVYVVADGGVAMFDRLSERWQVPVPLAIGPVRTTTRTLAVADPTADVLFISAGARMWIIRPATRFISSVLLAADARQLLLERSGRGAFVFAGGWWLVSPSGSAAPLANGQSPSSDDVLATPDAQQILRETPGLQSFGSLLSRDDQLRTWPLTALARVPDRTAVWAGTDGGGVFEVDPTFLRSTQRPYGLRNRGVSAVALAADGVWLAEEPDPIRAHDVSLTFASNDLAAWRWLSPIRGTSGIASMSIRGRFACLATEAGTFVVDLTGPTFAPRRYELPEVGRELAAWSTPDGCWVGGTTGAARVAWPGDAVRRPEIVAEGGGAFAFASSGDTVWAATQTGVRRYLGGRIAPEDRHASPGQAELPNALSFPVRGIALAGSGLALLTDRELWFVSGSNRMTSAERITMTLDRVGRTRRVAADDRTVWVAGSRGVLALSLADRRARFVDLADPFAPTDAGSFDDVLDLVLAPGAAWLGTRAGVVRVARGPDGLPR